MDVLEILGGRFSYLETVYEERDGEILRHQERIYIRRPKLRFVWKVRAVLLGTGIAMALFLRYIKLDIGSCLGCLEAFRHRM